MYFGVGGPLLLLASLESVLFSHLSHYNIIPVRRQRNHLNKNNGCLSFSFSLSLSWNLAEQNSMKWWRVEGHNHHMGHMETHLTSNPPQFTRPSSSSPWLSSATYLHLNGLWWAPGKFNFVAAHSECSLWLTHPPRLISLQPVKSLHSSPRNNVMTTVTRGENDINTDHTLISQGFLSRTMCSVLW